MREWLADLAFEAVSAVFTFFFVTVPRWCRHVRALREERISEAWRTEQRRQKL